MNQNQKKTCLRQEALQALAIIILVIAPAATFAQNRNTIDSLKTIINNKKVQDTTKIQAYIDLSSEYQDFNFDTALIYADSALKKSLNIDYKKGIADAYKQKAIALIYLNDYKPVDSLLFIAISNYQEINYQHGIMKCYIWLAFSARYYGKHFLSLNYCNKALKIVEYNNFIKDKALILNSKCLTYTKAGDFDKAIENGLEALKTFEEQNNKKQIINCNIGLGNLFSTINEFEKALEYIYEAFKLSTGLKKTREQSICLANIANIYSQQKKHEEALQNYNKSLELDVKNNDLHGMSANYNNMGSVYYKLEQYEKATKCFNKSLKIKKQIEDKHGMAICYFNIARLKTKLKNYNTAEEYCLKSMEIFEHNNELNNQQIALKELAIIYNNAGKYQKAYNTYVNAIAIKDSVFNIEKAERIAQLEEKYLNEKNKKQIQALEYETEIKQTEISHHKKLQNIYLIAFFFALVGIVLIVIQFRKKNSAYKFLVKKNIDLLNNEKELKSIKEQVIVNKSNNNNTILTDDKTCLPTGKKEEILSKLNQLFEIDNIFKDYDLTLNKLAKKISTNRNYLSQIINEEFGKSYSDFINEYRVKESILLFSDPQKISNLSIAGIAQEAGFWSIPRFNHAFKKYTGITPSNFKKNVNI